jgi:predicted alpha/beta superfamily hydrolase
MLQAGPFPMPPTVVVGVGYHFERPEDHARWGALRVRDFTPCGDALFDEQYGGQSTVGGADDFLGFLEDELTPFLAERLPIDLADRTLVGASLGGLFALYALMTRPGAFRRCVAISPALYWGAGRIFELEAALASAANDLPASLFLASGSLEEAHDPRCALVSNLYRLDSMLRSRA